MGERTRVLVADDNLTYGGLLCRFVASQTDMEVVGLASDGGEAIHLASLLEPDMVLMDVCMPGIDGIAATLAVAAMRRPAQVILLTAHHAPDSEQLCMNAGASGFLRKSDADAQLIDLIRALAGPPSGPTYPAPPPS